MRLLAIVALTAVAAIFPPAPGSASAVNIARAVDGRAVYKLELARKDHCFVFSDEGDIIPCDCNGNCLRRK